MFVGMVYVCAGVMYVCTCDVRMCTCDMHVYVWYMVIISRKMRWYCAWARMCMCVYVHACLYGCIYATLSVTQRSLMYDMHIQTRAYKPHDCMLHTRTQALYITLNTHTHILLLQLNTTFTIINYYTRIMG